MTRPVSLGTASVEHNTTRRRTHASCPHPARRHLAAKRAHRLIVWVAAEGFRLSADGVESRSSTVADDRRCARQTDAGGGGRPSFPAPASARACGHARLARRYASRRLPSRIPPPRRRSSRGSLVDFDSGDALRESAAGAARPPASRARSHWSAEPLRAAPPTSHQMEWCGRCVRLNQVRRSLWPFRQIRGQPSGALTTAVELNRPPAEGPKRQVVEDQAFAGSRFAVVGVGAEI